MEKERLNIVKLALALGTDLKHEVFAQSRQEFLDNIAKQYGKKYFSDLSPAQQKEAIEEYESSLLSEAHSLLNVVTANSSKMQKVAQSFWWSERRYDDLLTDKQKNSLKDRVKNIFAARKSWPKSHLVNNDKTEDILTEQFMDRFLKNMVPFRDDGYLEDDNILDVCVAMFLRNYPHLQTQYSNTFIPLQVRRSNEADAQEAQAVSDFFSDALPERTAKNAGLIITSDKMKSSKVEEGDIFLAKREISDRNGKVLSPGKYVLVDEPLSEEGVTVLSLVYPENQDDYLPDDIFFVEYPDVALEIVT